MSTYIRYSTVSLEDGIGQIQGNWGVGNARATFGERSVGVCSIRLRTFGRDARSSCGISCVACGLEATHFAVETFANGNQSTAHMNLYGMKDGGEVLFTHDHTLARALGGKDSLSNTKTMCSSCNFAKSKDEGKEALRRRKVDKKPKKV